MQNNTPTNQYAKHYIQCSQIYMHWYW